MRDVSKYKTLSEWYADVKGRVPLQMVAGLDNLMRTEGITFPEAYARLVDRRAIIEIEPK
jgi:hypothetical protein